MSGVFLSGSYQTGEMINASSIVSFKNSKNHRGGEVVIATLSDGAVKTIQCASADRAVEMCAPVIPAHPGYELLVAHEAGVDADEAWEGIAFFHHYPIIAWRFTEHGPSPVTPDNDYMTSSYHHDTTLYGIKYPDGQVCVLAEAHFENEAEWREWVKETFTDVRAKAAARAEAAKAAT